MERVIFYKEYSSNCKYGNSKVQSYIKIEIFIKNFSIFFCVSVPNYSVCRLNLVSAFLRVLEHESIGMSKYNRVKEVINLRLKE